MRRDSLILETSSRRGSVLLAADGLIGIFLITLNETYFICMI